MITPESKAEALASDHRLLARQLGAALEDLIRSWGYGANFNGSEYVRVYADGGRELPILWLEGGAVKVVCSNRLIYSAWDLTDDVFSADDWRVRLRELYDAHEEKLAARCGECGK